MTHWNNVSALFFLAPIYSITKIDLVNVSLDNIGKSVAKVNIYYKSMEYLSTQQMISISTEDFFSNIGGTLGLYIGISILSLIEVVELGFNLMLALTSSFKSKKQISQN